MVAGGTRRRRLSKDLGGLRTKLFGIKEDNSGIDKAKDAFREYEQGLVAFAAQDGEDFSSKNKDSINHNLTCKPWDSITSYRLVVDRIPLWKIWVRQLGWLFHIISNIWKVIKKSCSKAPTSNEFPSAMFGPRVETIETMQSPHQVIPYNMFFARTVPTWKRSPHAGHKNTMLHHASEDANDSDSTSLIDKST